MPLYSRRQLVLLVVVLAVAGVGLGVGQWRRSHADLAERLEQLDTSDPRHGVNGAGDGPPTRGGSAPPRGTGHERPDRASDDADIGPQTGAHRPFQGRRPLSKGALGHGLAQPLDLNRATAVELTRLPGVGPVLAERILAVRDASGAFGSVDDLRRVPGVGTVKLDRLRALVTVSGPAGGGNGDAMVH